METANTPWVSTEYVMYAFTAFQTFSGLMILFFNGSKYKDQYREDRTVIGSLITGVLLLLAIRMIQKMLL